MATGTSVSIREYLSTSYRPDRDYVDGLIEERNVGEKDHSKVLGAVCFTFYRRRKEWGSHVFPSQRIQVSPMRFRVPDLCVVLGEEPAEQIFRTPPFICIEVLSREDLFSKTFERMNDYLTFGVPYIWLIDPQTRTADRFTSEGMLRVKELRTENPEIVVPLAELFD